MKFTFIKDASRQEEVIICASEKNELVKQIEALIQKSNTQLFGYKGNQAISLNTHDVLCFTACEGKVFAITEKEKTTDSSAALSAGGNVWGYLCKNQSILPCQRAENCKV